MKFSMLLTTDLRLLSYFVTFMKRTKNAKLFESSDPPVTLCPFGMSPRDALCSQRAIVGTFVAPFPL